MAQTYGIVPAPVNASRVSRDSRGALDTNSLLKMYALIGQEKDRQFQEKKFVADNLYQAHNVFKDLKYLPRDADVVATHMAPVDQMLSQGVHNVDQSMELQSKLLQALQHPDMQRAILDYGKMDQLIKRGETLHKELGRNAPAYYGKLDEIANTKGSKFDDLKVTDYFDTETQKNIDEGMVTDRNYKQSVTDQNKVETQMKQTALDTQQAYKKYMDELLQDPDIPNYFKAGISNGSIKGDDLVTIVGASKDYAQQKAIEASDPTKKAKSFVDIYREWDGRKGGYGQYATPGSTTFNIGMGTGDSTVDAYIEKGMNSSFIAPGQTGSGSKYEGEATSIYWKNPATKQLELNPKWQETKSDQRAGRVISTFDNGQTIALNPREDNDPQEITKNNSRYKRKAEDLGVVSDQAGDLNTGITPFSIGIGDWTKAVSLTDGKPLSSRESIVDQWGFGAGSNTVIKRPGGDRSLTIQYPGKAPQELYWKITNEKARGGNDGIGGQSITVGDAVTNNVQIVQKYIQQAKAQGLTDAQIREKVILGYDVPGEQGIPQFTIKDVVWAPHVQGNVLTNQDLEFGKRVYENYKAKPGSTYVPPVAPTLGPQDAAAAKQKNLETNSKNVEALQFAKDNNFQGETAKEILSLDPQLLNMIMPLAKQHPQIFNSAISDTTDPRNNKTFHYGLALDFSYRNYEASHKALAIINDNHPGAIQQILLEGPTQEAVDKLEKDLYNIDNGAGQGLYRDIERSGAKIKKMVDKNVLSHIHVDFAKKGSVKPKTNQENIFNPQDSSDIEVPGF